MTLASTWGVPQTPQGTWETPNPFSKTPLGAGGLETPCCSCRNLRFLGGSKEHTRPYKAPSSSRHGARVAAGRWQSSSGLQRNRSRLLGFLQALLLPARRSHSEKTSPARIRARRAARSRHLPPPRAQLLPRSSSG